MSKGKKKTSSLKKLLIFALALAIVIGICLAGVYGVDKLRDSLLKQKIADVEKANQQKIEQYNAAVAELEREIAVSGVSVWPSPVGKGLEIVDVSDYQLENTHQVDVTRATLLSSGLILANQWHALPDDFETQTKELQTSIAKATNWGIGVGNANTSLFPDAVAALKEFVTAAKEEGLEAYCVDEAYRTMDYQQTLWDKEITRLSGNYSGDVLIAQAKKNTNYPGTSEYQTGSSFHIQLYEAGNKELNAIPFQSSEQGAYLNEHGWEYGFVFRFPLEDYPTSGTSDKSYITGVSSKRNMYRYVGKAHSTAMHILDMCLEEYIEYLMDHPHIAIYQDGALKFEIVRMTASDADTVSCPVTRSAVSYQADLDNMGGIILAYAY